MEKQGKLQIKASKASVMGPFIVDELYRMHAYIYQVNGYQILIDLPPFHLMDEVILEVSRVTQLNQLTHLIILTPTLSTRQSIMKIMDLGFNGVVITNRFLKRQLDLDIDIQTIESLKYSIQNNAQKLITFIPTSFMPYPEMFFVYAHHSEVLFSSYLGSSFYQKQPIQDPYDRFKAAQKFHQALIPNSDFLKAALKSIDKYEVMTIYPAYGYQIKPELFEEFTLFLSKLDFYNNYVVYRFNQEHEKEIDFKEAINHMLLRLEQYYSRIEILNVFIGSQFTIDPQSITLKRSHLVGYKMWHQFFELIYTKKGMPWLLILEPVVLKYQELKSIELPNIYQSLLLDLEKQKDQDSKAKIQLESDIIKLEQLKSDLMDQMLRCPITNLYLEDVLRQTLTIDLEHQQQCDIVGFALVQLDQLNEINRRYGKDSGDEAIRSMAYQLSQIKGTDSHIYKQKGPGIIVYLKNGTKDMMQTCALNARNTIADSDVFIEKVTASIATVSMDEIDLNQSVQEQIQQIFSLLERRMWFAKIQGKGMIIDETYTLPNASEGSILLVDEDPISRNMIHRIFTRLDYVVKVATSAKEAFDIVRTAQIDVIISEINLSKIDGFQLKQMLNETKAFKEIPYIMVSHNKTLDNIKRGNTLDVDLILEKPIVPEELVGHVKRFKERVAMV